jgi:hypothetical protein
MRARLANRSSSPPGPSVAGGLLRFAAATVGVTPPPGSRLAGYMARGDALAEGALDPLEATLIRLRDPRAGGETVTWVALDALAVDEALAGAIGEAVGAASAVPATSVVVCASHTHAGPTGWLQGIPFAAPEPGDVGMRAELVRRIASRAADLPGEETAVEIVIGVGEAQGVGTHRTDPGHASDRTLGALSMIDARGAIVGLLVDHASHATVLGHENRHWSADWPGAARRSLTTSVRGQMSPATSGQETTHDGTPVVAFLQGAAGDASPRFVRRQQSPAEVERIGGLFAAQALAVIHGAGTHVDDPTVAVRRRRVQVPTRNLPSPATLAARFASTEQAWRSVASESGTGSPQERIARTRHEGSVIAEALAARGLPPSVELPTSVVVIGHDAWLHLPVELFASHAAEIRKSSPFRQTRVIGYADGYAGYVADAEAYRLETYEAASSLFDAFGAGVLVDASIALLRQTHDELESRRDRA